MKRYKRAGTIGRFKPLHNGHVEFLTSLCQNSEQVIIGLGSPNKYDEKNPFTAKESKEMIDAALRKQFNNYPFAEILDCGDNDEWKQTVKKQFFKLDAFVTENTWVKSILEPDYKVVHPKDIMPKGKFLRLHATDIRNAIAKKQPWQHLVPIEVAKFIQERRLDDRFRKEFCEVTK